MNLIGEKRIKLQDAKFKLSENNNNETSIFIDKVLAEKLKLKDNSNFTFSLNKSNIIEALDFIYKLNQQLFIKGKLTKLDESWYQSEKTLINKHFNSTNQYLCKVSLGKGNRYYLKELQQKTGFNFRNLLVEDYFNINFYIDDIKSILVLIMPIKEKSDKIVYENNILRVFAFEVFKKIYHEYGDKFFKEHAKEQTTSVGNSEYIGVKFPNYFGNSKLLGIFNEKTVNSIIASESRFRYFKDPLYLYKDKPVFYFTTEFEYNRTNASNVLFENYKRFIEDYSDNYYTIFRNENGLYQLILRSMIANKKKLLIKNKSLREFAFQTFKIVHQEVGDDFLQNQKEYTTREHGSVKIKAILFPNYFGNKKIFAVFDKSQTKESLKTGNSLRFNPDNFKILGHEYIYFSAQWSYPSSDLTHPNFDEFVKFINDFGQGKFEIKFDQSEKNYNLFRIDMLDANNFPLQKIFFGPPGSGKSYHIKTRYPGNWPRVTFHPELDYQGFVGTYKPSVVRSAAGDQITYRYIEEAFTRAYCEAWKTDEPYYLIIEEINRGNCAQIFGDIFQLLDRGNDGFSDYPIICSPDLQQHLSTNLNSIGRLTQYLEKTGSDDFSRMSLPNNLNILCTMNTSDQSLFPMDNAFKRRWEWQYIPIDYDDANQFQIDLESEGNYNWGRLIKVINLRIKEHTQSEDKQIGNRFVSIINNRISADQFVSKVVFFLWSEIYKEEHGTGNTIFILNNDREITFNDFFDKGKVNLKVTKEFIENFIPTISNEATENRFAEDKKDVDSDEL
jgi:hypothetical protein